MKLVEVRNDTGKRLAFTAIRGLVFACDEIKKVTPATVKHPAVSQYIGRGLTLITSSAGEEPKAPIPTVTKLPQVVVPELPEKVVLETPEEVIPELPDEVIPEISEVKATVTESPKPVVEVAEPMPVPEPPVMETPKETASNLQEAYLAAPGVSEENVQDILNAFPTFELLTNSPISAVQHASGLSKNASKRLKDWAFSQLATK